MGNMKFTGSMHVELETGKQRCAETSNYSSAQKYLFNNIINQYISHDFAHCNIGFYVRVVLNLYT